MSLNTCRRLSLALAIAAATTALGTTTAVAAPANAAPAAPANAAQADAAPAIPLGSPQVVSNVLGPTDPAFWNPAAPGTRVLSPIDPRDDVICLSGFVPVINCWTKNRDELTSTMRPLVHVDVPAIGAPPLRIWVDLPRWGDGSTGEGRIRELTNRVVVWWLTNPATPS